MTWAEEDVVAWLEAGGEVGHGAEPVVGVDVGTVCKAEVARTVDGLAADIEDTVGSVAGKGHIQDTVDNIVGSAAAGTTAQGLEPVQPLVDEQQHCLGLGSDQMQKQEQVHMPKMQWLK